MTDLRYKLTEAERDEIRRLWAMGFNNYSYLAKKYKVHSKTIRKIIDDNYRIACNEFNRENWKRYRPSKEHHAELMRKYRKRKRNRNENN